MDISEGRDISEEEYASGSKVCLAPASFMKNNGLSLGDKIKVQLLYSVFSPAFQKFINRTIRNLK